MPSSLPFIFSPAAGGKKDVVGIGNYWKAYNAINCRFLNKGRQ